MMTEENSEAVNAFTGIALLVSVAIGLLIFFTTSDAVMSICTPLLIFGAYEIISSVMRSRVNDQFGTNESDAAVLWGFVFIIAGGAGFVYTFSSNLLLVAIFIVLAIALYLVVRIARSRN